MSETKMCELTEKINSNYISYSEGLKEVLYIMIHTHILCNIWYMKCNNTLRNLLINNLGWMPNPYPIPFWKRRIGFPWSNKIILITMLVKKENVTKRHLLPNTEEFEPRLSNGQVMVVLYLIQNLNVKNYPQKKKLLNERTLFNRRFVNWRLIDHLSNIYRLHFPINLHRFVQ